MSERDKIKIQKDESLFSGEKSFRFEVEIPFSLLAQMPGRDHTARMVRALRVFLQKQYGIQTVMEDTYSNPLVDRGERLKKALAEGASTTLRFRIANHSLPGIADYMDGLFEGSAGARPRTETEPFLPERSGKKLPVELAAFQEGIRDCVEKAISKSQTSVIGKLIHGSRRPTEAQAR